MTVDPADSSMGPAAVGERRNRTVLREDVSVAVVLLLVGVLALIWTAVQGMPFRVALFPRIAAAGMVLCSLVLGARAALTMRLRETADGDRGAAVVPILTGPQAAAAPSAISALGLVMGTALYVLVLPTGGFVIGTALGMALGMLAIGYRRPIRVAVITVGFTASAYWLFFRVLNVPDLPPRLPW